MVPERMDDPETPRAELEASLRFIRAINRRLGGTRALIDRLERWSARWPRGKPVRLIDLGAGSADIPVAVRRWATLRGHDVRVTAVELHPTTAQLAREYVAEKEEIGGVEVIEHDALALTDRFPPGSFDYAHAGMFLHHFNDVEVLTLLRIMDRLAERGVVWNDLLRGRLPRLGVRLLTARAPEIVRHDARASVDKGFTKSEAVDLARRVDLGWLRWSASPLAGRFTLAGERPV